MAPITGHDGSVTFASGYTTYNFAWTITDGGASVETTPFQPPGDSITRSFAIADWSGEYRCRQVATVNTGLTLAGGYYAPRAHSFTLEMTAQDLLTTPFGANYNTRIAGLLSATGSYDCYLDNTVVLPQRGSSDTVTLTIDAGDTYTIPMIVREIGARVSTDGSDRHVTVTWESNGNFTETGTPIIGVGGAAVFIAEGGRQYSGNIIVTRIAISQTASRDIAEYTFGFVGNGDLTAA